MGKGHCTGGNEVLAGEKREWMPSSQNSKWMAGKGDDKG